MLIKKKKKKTPAIFELLVPERIIRPVVSASALTWYEMRRAH
jgi:hypothetical protein